MNEFQSNDVIQSADKRYYRATGKTSAINKLSRDGQRKKPGAPAASPARIQAPRDIVESSDRYYAAEGTQRMKSVAGQPVPTANVRREALNSTKHVIQGLSGFRSLLLSAFESVRQGEPVVTFLFSNRGIFNQAQKTLEQLSKREKLLESQLQCIQMILEDNEITEEAPVITEEIQTPVSNSWFTPLTAEPVPVQEETPDVLDGPSDTLAWAYLPSGNKESTKEAESESEEQDSAVAGPIEHPDEDDDDDEEDY